MAATTRALPAQAGAQPGLGVREVCDHGCNNGACVVCSPNADTRCQGSSVYWVDSCGQLGSLKETCGDGCSAGACTQCSSHATSKCYGTDAYWYDSCGKREDLKQDCPGTMTVAPACTCVMSADASSYPLTSCPSAPCCFTYTSTAGNTCFL